MSADPLPEPPALAAEYDAAYYGSGSTKFAPGFEQVRSWFIRRRARGVLGRLRSLPSAALDVGCGSGAFLNALSHYGCEIFGTELPGPALQRAREVPGIHLAEGDLTHSSFPESSFDLLTLWHVLEHLRDPFQTLQHCQHFMKDGALLVVEVPNLESWQSKIFGDRWLHLDPPRHVHQFTALALESMLNRAEFQIRSLRKNGFDMAFLGALQGLLDLFVEPKNLFYDVVRRSQRRDVSWEMRARSLLLATLFSPIALGIVILEWLWGAGAVLRYACVKKAGRSQGISPCIGNPSL